MLFKKTKHQNGESQKALEEATLHVEQARTRNHEVVKVTNALREARRSNHFAEQIALIMGK